MPWVLLVAAALTSPATARADHGLDHRDDSVWGVGMGPVFAWGEDFSVGLEVGTYVYSPLTHFVFGFDRRDRRTVPEQTIYAAWEPGLLVGGSLGVSSTSPLDPQHPGPARTDPMAGAWAGIAIPAGEPANKPIPDSDYRRWLGVWISLSLGYRYLADDHQFFLAPKLGYYTMPSPNS